MELDLKRRGWVFRELRDKEGKIICDSPLSLTLPTFDPSCWLYLYNTSRIGPLITILSLSPQTKPPSTLNSLLTLPFASVLDPLQYILNTTVRVILSKHKSDHA